MVFGANTENNPRCDIIQLAQKPYSKPDFENIMVFGAKMAKISWFLAQNIMVFGAEYHGFWRRMFLQHAVNQQLTRL